MPTIINRTQPLVLIFVVSIMGKNKKGARNFSLVGFMRLVRWPNLLILLLAQYFTVYFLAGAIDSILNIEMFLLAISTSILAAAGYLINDYYDVKIDYINKPDRVIVDKILKRRVVMVVHTLMNFTGITIGLYLSLEIGIIHFVSAFFLWLYSNQLKRLPFVGNFVVAALTGLSISIIGIYFKQNQLLVHTYALFAFCISLIREIIKDMEDLKGDSIFGCRTLPIIWGIRKTKNLVYILIIIFFGLLYILSHQLNNSTLIYYFTVLSVFVVYFVYKLYRADTVRDFYTLSQFSKVVMLSGILSMMFF